MVTNTKPTADLEKYKAMVATFSTKRILEEARGLGMFYRQGQIPTPELDAKMEILEEALKPTAEVSVNWEKEFDTFHESGRINAIKFKKLPIWKKKNDALKVFTGKLIEKTLQAHTTALKGRVAKSFRERVWSLAEANFDSLRGGEDSYTITKKDLNKIVEYIITNIT